MVTHDASARVMRAEVDALPSLLMEICMKQLVVAIGFAIASSAVSADSIKGCNPKVPCAPLGIRSSQLDFSSLEGRTTPMDVPLPSDSPGTVRISSGANGSAQIVADWFANHNVNPRRNSDVLASIGGLQIAFPNNVSAVTMAVSSDDSAASPGDTSEFALTAIMLDAEGNLVDSSVASENSRDETGAVRFVSALPFRKLVLTPSADIVWTVTALAVEGNNVDVPTTPTVHDDRMQQALQNPDVKDPAPIDTGVERPSLQDVEMKKPGFQKAAELQDLDLVNDPVETRAVSMDENLIPVNDPGDSRSAAG
jgi:hypothetical protein